MSYYKNPVTRQTARMVSIVCGLLFSAFAALYTLQMQALLLATAKHVAGNAGFHPRLATGIVLIVLLVPPMLMNRTLRLPLRWRAAVWLPSCIALGWLTNIHFPFEPAGGQPVSQWVFLLAFILWCMVVAVVRQFHDSPETRGSFAQFITPNAIILLVGFCFVGLTGNTSALLHQEIRQTYLLSRGDYDGVLGVGEHETRTSHSQQAIRAVALSRMGQMGERLFHYPMTYGSEGLLPQPADSLRSLNLPRYVYHHIGGHPGKPLHTPGGFQTATGFLSVLAHTSKSPAARDYWLCALLLDRRVDDFATALAQTADSVSPSLPRHYREALALHNRMHSRPAVLFHDGAIEENLSDFLAEREQHAGKPDERIHMYDYYASTYWFYYFYR